MRLAGGEEVIKAFAKAGIVMVILYCGKMKAGGSGSSDPNEFGQPAALHLPNG
jgi:hypothetical protein